MMNKSLTRVLIDSCKLLDWSSLELDIEKLEQLSEKNMNIVAFIGHYSAGKSSLINSILNRKGLLPQGTTETTSIPTYISYGLEEKGIVHLVNGKNRIISISEIGKIVQICGMLNPDEIDYLEVFLNNKLLKNGLILLDTPGLNTLIQRHENMMKISLTSALSVVYVCGKQPSSVDCEMLEKICHDGYDTYFVRTHCDEIRASEESYKDVQSHDLTIVDLCGVRKENCFHVSNEETSEYYTGIGELRTLLECLAKCSTSKIQEVIDKRLEVIRLRCVAGLKELQTSLLAIVSGNTEKINHQKQEIKSKIALLKNNIQNRQSKIGKSLQNCRHELDNYGSEQLIRLLGQVRKAIEDNNLIKSDLQMRTIVKKESVLFCENARTILNQIVNPRIAQICSQEEDSSNQFADIELPEISNFSQLDLFNSVEVEQLKEYLKILNQEQAEIESYLEKSKSNGQVLASQLQSIEQELLEINEHYAGIPAYRPQLNLMENKYPQPSQIAKTVGNIADWALIFIPSSAALKIPGLTKNLAKVIGSAEKVTKIVKKADTIKDVTYALNNITKTYATAKRLAQAEEMVVSTKNVVQLAQKSSENSSLFDYLSISYWAGKIGENFDSPPKYEVDREYETVYNQNKREIECKLKKQKIAAYEKRKELGILNTEIGNQEAHRQSLLVNESEVYQELQRLEADMKQKAKEKSRMEWCKLCADKLCEHLEKLASEIINDYYARMSAGIMTYQNQRVERLEEKLNYFNVQLVNMDNYSENDAKTRLDTVDQYLNQLEQKRL